MWKLTVHSLNRLKRNYLRRSKSTEKLLGEAIPLFGFHCCTEKEGEFIPLFGSHSSPAVAAVPDDHDGDVLLPSGPRPTLGPYRHWLLIVVCFCLSLSASTFYMIFKLWMFFRLWESTTPFSLCFFFVEFLMYLSHVVWSWDFTRPPLSRKRLSLGPADPFPRVSLLITSCNEDLDVLQDTVRSALALDYPGDAYTVWVLDDGGDDALKDWVETLAEESGRRLKYVRRPKPKGVPHHYKAGNLNYALKAITDEFVAVVDADMILAPDFLTGMLPHFASPKIAFVQSPQSFYNISPGDPLAGSLTYFYDIVLPTRDAWGCAQCVGTGVVFRRSRLNEIGNFATGGVTEDIGTSCLLHAQGFDSVYLKQRFQIGLTPWTLDRYVKQQQRWCLGEMQMVWQRGLIWHRGGGDFPLSRRCVYFQSVIHSFLAFATVGLMLLALVLCFYGPSLLPLGAAESDYRMYILILTPHLLLGRIVAQVIYLRIPGLLFRQEARIRAEQHWWWMSPYKCMAVLRAFVPWIPKTFEATGSRSVEEESGGGGGRAGDMLALWNTLQLIGFHLMYVVVALIGIGWRITIVNTEDCADLFMSTWVILFLSFAVQQMSEPILFAMFPPSYPSESDRRSLLKYDKNGVPVFRDNQTFPPSDWRVLGLEILPMAQAILWIYFLWKAMHPDDVPRFCNGSFFVKAAV